MLRNCTERSPENDQFVAQKAEVSLTRSGEAPRQLLQSENDLIENAMSNRFNKCSDVT